MMSGDGFGGLMALIVVVAGVLGWLFFGKVLPWVWAILRPIIHAATGA
jgi:hypothetical protein